MIRVTLDLSIEQLAKTLASTLMEMHTGVYAGDKSIVGMLRDALVSTYDAGIAEGRSQRGKLTVDDGAIGVIRAPEPSEAERAAAGRTLDGIKDWVESQGPSKGDATPLVPRFEPPEGSFLLEPGVKCQCPDLFDGGNGRWYCCGKGAPKIHVAAVSLSGEGSGG